LDPVFAIGITGMLFIITGWAISITSLPPLRLSTLYFVGSLLLTIYAILQQDPVFTALNSAATLLAFINIIRTLKSSAAKKEQARKLANGEE